MDVSGADCVAGCIGAEEDCCPCTCIPVLTDTSVHGAFSLCKGLLCLGLGCCDTSKLPPSAPCSSGREERCATRQVGQLNTPLETLASLCWLSREQRGLLQELALPVLNAVTVRLPSGRLPQGPPQCLAAPCMLLQGISRSGHKAEL